MTMVWLGFGAAPVPSMMVTFVSATTGSVTLTYWLRTCCESFVAAWADECSDGESELGENGIANLNERMAPPEQWIAIPRLTARDDYCTVNAIIMCADKCSAM